MNNDLETILQEHYRLLATYRKRIKVLESTKEVKEFLRMQDRITTLFAQTKRLEEQKSLELQEVSRK